MLWYKSWLETRWRFLIGFAVLVLSACGSVFAYPEVVKLLPLASQVERSGEIGRRVADAVNLASSYRGYIWSQWFHQNMTQMWTLFAALLGTGGLVSQASGGGGLFTLSLPASRNRMVGIRAATGLIELLVLAFVPSFLVPLFSPAVGKSYGLGETLIYSACIFIAGSIFFSLASLLSTIFTDVWRPPLLVLFLAGAISIGEQLISNPAFPGVFHIMSAETYFRNGQLPWLGLLFSAAVSAALLYAASRNIARQDF
jgi:hypothetical protein